MEHSLFVGCYGKDGIVRYRFDGTRLERTHAVQHVNASCLRLSQDRRRIYAVSETQRYQGAAGGSIAAYSILGDGSLEKISEKPSHGLYPCDLMLIGRTLLVCNYTSGRICRYLLAEDGRIGKLLPLLQYDAPSGDTRSSHLHQAVLTPDGHIAIADSGLDRIYFYRAPEIDARQPFAVASPVPDGYGPRALAFPGGLSRSWFVLCEKQSYLMVYQGGPAKAQRVSRIAIGNGRVESIPAALRVSPDRRFMAITSRGLDTILLFYLCDNGMPALLLETPSRGSWPRDAQFSPDGRFLAVANERSNNVVVFSVDNGHLNYIAQAAVDSPASLLFRSERT